MTKIDTEGYFLERVRRLLIGSQQLLTGGGATLKVKSRRRHRILLCPVIS